MTEEPAVPDGSALCTNCGICCDGTLYSWARSAAGEEPALAAAGLTTFEVEGYSAFHMPCPRLDGACCTIYETRFHACRTFHCTLLRRYQAGEIGPEEASSTIAEAKRLREQLRAIAPAAVARKERRALQRTNRWKTIAEPEERARRARLALEINVFEDFLNRKFRPRPVQD